MKIEKDSLIKGIKISDVFEAHAKKLYSEHSLNKQHGGWQLARRILNGDVKDGQNLRAIYRHRWPGLENLGNVLDALDYLEEKNWVRHTNNSSRSRQSKILKINPRVYAQGVLL